MIGPPKCWDRGCIHYTGIIQPDGTELTECPACKAFPDGIPDEITDGSNLHLTVYEGQTGLFIFEKGE